MFVIGVNTFSPKSQNKVPMTQTLPQESVHPHPAVLQYLREFARTYKPMRAEC